jgi:hypothetical protein
VPVRDGQHLDDALLFTVDNCKWKAPQNELARRVLPSGPAARRFGNQLYRFVDLGNELYSSRFGALNIQLTARLSSSNAAG